MAEHCANCRFWFYNGRKWGWCRNSEILEDVVMTNRADTCRKHQPKDASHEGEE